MNKLYQVDQGNSYEARVYTIEGGWVDREGVVHSPIPGFTLLIDAEDTVVAYVKNEVFPNGKTRPEVIAEILSRAESAPIYDEYPGD